MWKRGSLTIVEFEEWARCLDEGPADKSGAT